MMLRNGRLLGLLMLIVSAIVLLSYFYYYLLFGGTSQTEPQYHSARQISFPQQKQYESSVSLAERRKNHQMTQINDNFLWRVTNDITDKSDIDVILDNILIVRVPGTPGNLQVRNYIANRMQQLGWHTELDQFDDRTPLGTVNFANIIATLDPRAERYLVLACHYDSKLYNNMVFVGAVDSAVPCAMMINLAKTLQQLLNNKKYDNSVTTELSLKFLFLDGEEAFVEWTATDSIYGARHLAQKWENERVLDKIDIFMLLDLLGTPNPRFYSYFEETDKWYARLADAEARLSRAGALEKYGYSSASSTDPAQVYFQPYSFRAGIEDDHIPFLRRNVSIIHLIPSPFPEVWHKDIDDRKAVDMNTVENIIKILRVFILEYLNVNVE